MTRTYEAALLGQLQALARRPLWHFIVPKADAEFAVRFFGDRRWRDAVAVGKGGVAEAWDLPGGGWSLFVGAGSALRKLAALAMPTAKLLGIDAAGRGAHHALASALAVRHGGWYEARRVVCVRKRNGQVGCFCRRDAVAGELISLHAAVLADYEIRVCEDWGGRLVLEAASAIEGRQAGGRTSKPRRPRRRPRRGGQKVRPLTGKQAEAVHIVGECGGNIAEAARRLGVNAKTVRQHYSAAMAKLGRAAGRQHARPTRLARDRRGQENLAEGNDVRRR
jgi:DNA-binding CsgD family transcriptional regulator